MTQPEFVTLKRGQNIKFVPYAFTEQGVAMLSSVLKSRKAVRVNIAIMRAFVELRGALAIHRAVIRELIDLRKKVLGHDDQLAILADVIRRLEEPPQAPPESPKPRIGFRP